ncbi:MAG TPA: hypothetical protein VN033_13355 [Vulgatibacter sp.]|nr:hypothetical protein [Vulgatibacter sp.]
MESRWSPIAGALLAAVLGGCGIGAAPDGVIESCESSLSLPPGVSTDILFVIDDSESMTEEQDKVVAELETFVSVLLEGPVANDFQVGVVSTSVSRHVRACTDEGPPQLTHYPDASGRLQSGKDAKGRPVDPDGPRILRWDDPDFLPSFRTLVRQGIRGSGQEMGLEAMRRALSAPLSSGPNAGFLRPGSRLLVVIVSDEDDCSDPSGTALTLQPPCEDVPCASDAACGAEGSYCLGADGDRHCQPNACETAAGRAALEPVEAYVDFLLGLDDGTGQGRGRETFLAVIGAFGLEAPHPPERCAHGGDEAQGIAVRYREAVDLMGDRGYADSICGASYGTALREIARLAGAPHVLDLARPPADPRLLRIEITREGGETLRCRVGDGFRYEAPASGQPARVVLDDRCRLRHGDHVELKTLCAG